MTHDRQSKCDTLTHDDEYFKAAHVPEIKSLFSK